MDRCAGAGILTSTLMCISAVLSIVAFYSVAIQGQSEMEKVEVLRWVTSGALEVHWAFRIDTLTAVMLVVVTYASSLMHIYSIGYMSHDPHQPRFFAYLSLFTFAMLMLVTSDNFLQLFFGWEGVGLASYLLIGFWYQKPSANAAAIKAFVVNRVGDFGFALGIFAIFMVFGSIEFDDRIRVRLRSGRPELRVPRLSGRRSDHDLPASVHGRHGQVGAVPPAHLAAGCDGRPDTGLRPDPRGDHGHGRCVPGGAPARRCSSCRRPR